MERSMVYNRLVARALDLITASHHMLDREDLRQIAEMLQTLHLIVDDRAVPVREDRWTDTRKTVAILDGLPTCLEPLLRER